jgi:hypothetical protein
MILKVTKAFFASYIFLLFFICSGCDNNTVRTGMEGKELPNFSFLLPDGKSWYKTNDRDKSKSTVLFIFLPECPFSQMQMTEIIENMEHLKDIQFLIVTPFPYSGMKSFYSKFHLDRFKNITTGSDTTNYYGQYMGASAVPFLAVYNKGGQLKKVMLGNTSYKDLSVD